MSKDSVLSSIILWTPGAWAPNPDYSPTNMTPFELDSYAGIIRDLISTIYDASTEAAAMLESLASSNSLRIGSYSEGPAFRIPVDPQIGNDSYLLFNPTRPVFSINNSGDLFTINSAVVLAHEIGHTAGLIDPVRNAGNYATDAFINLATSISPDVTASNQVYSYTPDIVLFENRVASDLGIYDQRVSYDAAFSQIDSRYGELSALWQQNGSFTPGGTIDLIRIGDQDPTTKDNVFDYSEWTSSPNVLAFGFSGDDIIIDSDGNSFLYGGSGNDTIDGGKGDDYIDGGTDDDIIRGGEDHDRIYGGDGDDHLWGGDGYDFIKGGSGDDVIRGDAGDDNISGGAGADFISGGDGNDQLFGTISEFGAPEYLIDDGFSDRILGGNGNDLIYAGAGDIVDGDDGDDMIFGSFNNSASLQGGAGQDFFALFLHDMGAVDYIVTVADSGGDGQIQINNRSYGLSFGNGSVFHTSYGDTLERIGDDLLIDLYDSSGSVLISNYTDGMFGITLMSNSAAPAEYFV